MLRNRSYFTIGDKDQEHVIEQINEITTKPTDLILKLFSHRHKAPAYRSAVGSGLNN
jgi:hypothetical protein